MQARTLGLSVVGAAVVLAAVYLTGPDRPDPAASRKPALVSAATTIPVRSPAEVAPGSAAGAGRPNVPGHRPPLLNVSRLSQLEQLNYRGNEQRGQAIYELQLAMNFCKAAMLESAHPEYSDREQRETPEGKRRFQQHARFAREFCDETAVDPAQLQAVMLKELSPDDPFMQTSILDPASNDPAVAALGSHLASQTDSPAALERASEFLIDRQEELPAMTGMPRPSSIKGSQARADAQRLIVKMVACQVRGGCGANELYTALWCLNCAPGMTLEQGWQRQYAPDTLDYARAVAAKIIAAEASN